MEGPTRQRKRLWEAQNSLCKACGSIEAVARFLKETKHPMWKWVSVYHSGLSGYAVDLNRIRNEYDKESSDGQMPALRR